MEILNLVQGSPEWHEHRDKTDNASDAPAMLGESDYKTRDELLFERHTGIKPQIDKATQKRFDDGHEAEAKARPIAEEILGEELYPVVGREGRYGASFDGLTMAENIALEHKSINDKIRAVLSDSTDANALPLMYTIQMEQQLMVSNAEKVLFLATKWEGDKCVEKLYGWYVPDLALRQRIIDGWDLFHKDLETYVPPESKVQIVPKEIKQFPAPSIVVKGELVACNLEKITPVFDAYLADTNTELKTDQDFADGDVDAKNSRAAAKNLRLTAEAVVSQIEPVSEVVRTLNLYAEKFDALGLKLEKAVKEGKDLIKANAISAAKVKFIDHVRKLETETSPIRLNIETPDFAGEIKGLKTLSSMHTKINAALANGIVDSEAVARDIRAKKAWYEEYAKDYTTLFADLQTIIFKQEDDFQLLVKSRIDQHKVQEGQRTQEAAKKLLQEQEAAQTSVAPVAETTQPTASVSSAKPVIGAVSSKPIAHMHFSGIYPSQEELAEAVAFAYGATKEQASKWLIEAYGLQKAA